MPNQTDYLFEVRKLLDDNSLITEAWLDDPDHPTALHIRHKRTFNLHKCKMSIPLAKLKLVFHAGPRRANNRPPSPRPVHERANP